MPSTVWQFVNLHCKTIATKSFNMFVSQYSQNNTTFVAAQLVSMSMCRHIVQQDVEQQNDTRARSAIQLHPTNRGDMPAQKPPQSMTVEYQLVTLQHISWLEASFSCWSPQGNIQEGGVPWS